MGKLIDQDYLWLQEKPQRQSSSNRLVPIIVITLAVLGGGWYYFAASDHDTHSDASATVAPADNSIDARTGVHTSQLMPHRATPGSARAYPAVAHPNQAELTPVNQIIGSDPASTLDQDIDVLAEGDSQPADASAEPSLPPGWQAVDIRSGDTLSIAFGRHGLSYMDSLKLAHLPEYGRYFTRSLKSGDRLTVKADASGRVEALDYPIDVLHTIEIRRHGDKFSGRITTPDVDHRRAYASGVITTSFYADALASGLDDHQIITLNHIFSWDIDFAQDIQPGDRFVAVYDELYRDGHKIGNGALQAAAFINKGHVYRALRYTDDSGDAAYYTPSGRPMKQAFVRAPVNYTRISSAFSGDRMHPILHRIRRHTGTDYAAPSGTPIHATGSGRIIFQGRRGGYGNMVIIRHNADITMRFGHMSRFTRNLHTGSHVKQGEVIGYVGMTGLATGPHVHYEFRVDGVPKNPQTVSLPGMPPLSGTQLADFHHQTSTLVARLDDMSQTQVAQVADSPALRAN